MARILAVSNYPTAERFERLRKCLAESGAEVTSTDWVGTAASKSNEFDGVALSETSPMATVKHETRPPYGVQFHPERYGPDNSAGNRVIGNFVKLPR